MKEENYERESISNTAPLMEPAPLQDDFNYEKYQEDDKYEKPTQIPKKEIKSNKNNKENNLIKSQEIKKQNYLDNMNNMNNIPYNNQNKIYNIPSNNQNKIYNIPNNNQNNLYQTPNNNLYNIYNNPNNIYNTPYNNQNNRYNIPYNNQNNIYNIPNNNQSNLYQIPNNNQNNIYTIPNNNQNNIVNPQKEYKNSKTYKESEKINLNTSLTKSTLTVNPDYSDDKGKVLLMDEIPVEATEFQNDIKEGTDTIISKKNDMPKKIKVNDFENNNLNIKESKCNLKCLDDFNRPNNYHFELASIFNLIYFFICLAALLIGFIDYKDFTFKPIIHLGFFYGSWLVAGIVFIFAKLFQYRRNYDHDLLAVVFAILLYIFTFIQFFGIWTIPEMELEFEEKTSRSVVLLYLIYFIFGIVYYFTITMFTIKKKAINFSWFFIIGFIYVGISTLTLYLISKNNEKYTSDIEISGLILYIMEVTFYNFGIGLAYCRDVLNEYQTSYNVLHIEIYKIYPILLLVSIPVIIIAVSLACCCLMFGYNYL